MRAELAALEAAGYLTHPHTSAGRVPTELGYRRHVDSLLAAGSPPAERESSSSSELRREIDEAMRETTTALAQVTDLMALVTAPPETVAATIHRVEVLRLQPSRVTVVAIASNGAVAKRVFDFPAPVDPGLVEWASSYLNESLAGLGRRRPDDRQPARRSRAWPGRGRVRRHPRRAFTELEQEESSDTLYMEGASRLLSEAHSADLPRADRLMTALEERASLLGMLRSALDQRSVFLWIGGENPQPELRSVSIVGANYGLAHRNLGAVGVVGPLRMDYATAIASVRGAARELSRYCETVYDG